MRDNRVARILRSVPVSRFGGRGMRRFRIHRVLTIVFCVVATMVSSAENSDMPREILPLAAEPEFEFLEYSGLPRNVQMVVKCPAEMQAEDYESVRARERQMVCRGS